MNQQPSELAMTGGQQRPPEVQRVLDHYSSRPDDDVTVMRGQVVSLSRDQDGSRLVQRLLCNERNIAIVFAEIEPALTELMSDVFGNYVVQKLLEVSQGEMQNKILSLMKGRVLTLSLQTYGCRVVQKAFDCVPHEWKIDLALELDGSIPQCVFDQNANHVIQKCVENIPSHVQFIVDAFLGRVVELSCHAYGCRVLQRIFEKCCAPEVATDVNQVLREVLKNIDTLVMDQYGNYVVQHGLINCDSTLKPDFIALLSPKVFELSCSKFASNVSEKLFQFADDTQRDHLLDTVMVLLNDGRVSPLVVMMQDQYANYVVQKLVDKSTPTQRQRIVDHIRPHVAAIRRGTYGRHILSRLEKMGLLPPSENTRGGMGSGGRGGGNGGPGGMGGGGMRGGGQRGGMYGYPPQAVGMYGQQQMQPPPMDENPYQAQAMMYGRGRMY